MTPPKETDAEDNSQTVLAFGPFRLSLATMTLTQDGRPVALGARAISILAALAMRPGETVFHEDLVAKAWPGVTVLPDNLRVQIAGLRQVLNRGGKKNAVITNIAGRGYQLVGPVEQARGLIHRPKPFDGWKGVPSPLVRLIGRGESVTAVRVSLLRHRLTTVVGAGGVGKSTLAIAAVWAAGPPSVLFADLSSLVDAEALADTLAAAAGLGATQSPLDDLIAHFEQRPGLLMLDNCEHLLPGCAAFVEQLLAAAPSLKILATSRHPLQIGGEEIRKIYPLELPPRTTQTLSDAQTYPSVQLLIERTLMTGLQLDLTDADAPYLVDICRNLDGVPLAIELAAATVGGLGLKATASALRDRLDSLREGSRTAHPRQRTLWATFAWSYELLSPVEQGVLRRLCQFDKAASFEAISQACQTLNLTDDAILGALTRLVEKSLVTVDVADELPLYDVLQATRAFARAPLDGPIPAMGTDGEDALTPPERWSDAGRPQPPAGMRP